MTARRPREQAAGGPEEMAFDKGPACGGQVLHRGIHTDGVQARMSSPGKPIENPSASMTVSRTPPRPASGQVREPMGRLGVIAVHPAA